jgi:hypothetical protein
VPVRLRGYSASATVCTDRQGTSERAVRSERSPPSPVRQDPGSFPSAEARAGLRGCHSSTRTKDETHRRYVLGWIRKSWPGRLRRTTTGRLSSGGERLSINKRRSNGARRSLVCAGQPVRVAAFPSDGSVVDNERESAVCWEAVRYACRAVGSRQGTRAHDDQLDSRGKESHLCASCVCSVS